MSEKEEKKSLKEAMYEKMPWFFRKCKGGNIHWPWAIFCLCNVR